MDLECVRVSSDVGLSDGSSVDVIVTECDFVNETSKVKLSVRLVDSEDVLRVRVMRNVPEGALGDLVYVLEKSAETVRVQVPEAVKDMDGLDVFIVSVTI